MALLGAKAKGYIVYSGDSYMAGAGGVSLPGTVEATLFRGVHNNGVGGDTLANQTTITLAMGSHIRAQCLLLFWDASNNGYGTTPVDLALYQSMKAAFPRSLFFPPLRLRTYSGDAPRIAAIDAMQTAMRAEFGTQYLDAQAVLVAGGNPVSDAADIAENYIPDSLLQVDDVHLTAPGMALVSTAAISRLTSLGW